MSIKGIMDNAVIHNLNETNAKSVYVVKYTGINSFHSKVCTTSATFVIIQSNKTSLPNYGVEKKTNEKNVCFC